MRGEKVGIEQRQLAYEVLLELANKQGYVTFDDIMDAADRFSLPIQDFDWLSSSITTYGIIVYSERPLAQKKTQLDEDDEVDDFAQSDYDVIYDRIIELNPSLKPFVEYVRNVIPPQRRETRKLKYQISEGNSFARMRMIEMHMRLALRIALQRAETYGMEIEDAVSYGCIGLINAVDKYDPDTSGPFASYAALWIVQNISREQATQRPLIYYPVHKKQDYYLIYPILKDNGCIGCGDLLGCSKAVQLVTEKLKCSEEEASTVILESIPDESIEYLADVGQRNNFDDVDNSNESLGVINDNFLYEERLSELVFSQMETDTDEIFYELSNKLLRLAIDEQLGQLTEKQAKVLRLRYGYYGREKTLEEIGNQFEVTRERIRQIEAKALDKLRHSAKVKYLEEFL